MRVRNAQSNARVSFKRLERSLAARFFATPALTPLHSRQAEVTYTPSHLHLQHQQGHKFAAGQCVVQFPGFRRLHAGSPYLRISSQKIRSNRHCTDDHAIFPISTAVLLNDPTPPTLQRHSHHSLTTSSSSHKFSTPQFIDSTTTVLSNLLTRFRLRNAPSEKSIRTTTTI